ncbi:uncharacterized protein [Centruroides vittatus]|uniref:uncharacterized protein n=1 Tax=Centruroides vittatus TaxID=120091 RepID=UPI00350F86DB
MGHIGGGTWAMKGSMEAMAVGEPNKEGESILGFAVAFDLGIVNSFFTKQESHLITFNSGPHSSQIDYILTRREHLATVINCKVIPTDQVSAQHRLMCIDMKLRMYRKSGNTQMKIIKWFRLREERARAEYVERVLLQISQEWRGCRTGGHIMPRLSGTVQRRCLV